MQAPIANIFQDLYNEGNKEMITTRNRHSANGNSNYNI